MRSLGGSLSFALLFWVGCAVSGRVAGAPDGGDAGTEADAGPDAGTAPDAGRDAGAGDGGSASDGGGDRNLTVDEPYPASLWIQNGGRVLNLRVPPPDAGVRAAVGDGVTDDTAAFQDAYDFLRNAFMAQNAVTDPIGRIDSSNYVLYLPNGTYLVSDTLIYRGPTLQAQAGGWCGDAGPSCASPWLDLVRVRIAGESREGTTVRLADGATGFATPSTPKILLAFQHPDTTFNDWPADNLLKNVTLDTGSGNPGAAAILWQGANVSGMRNVAIRSGAGAGRYGIWTNIGPVQGCVRDVTITGFDFAIAQTGSYGGQNGCYEHVTLANQGIAGVWLNEGLLVLRDLAVQESAPGVPAVLADGVAAQVIVLESEFNGGSGPALQATPDAGAGPYVFVRRLATTGYASAVAVAGATAPGGTIVTEWGSHLPVTLFDGGATSLDLPVEDPPTVAWFDPATQWASPQDYGAVGDGVTDDSVALQAALNAGKPVVVLPAAHYYAQTQLTVPATVQRIDGLGATFTGQPLLISAGAVPLLCENLNKPVPTTLQIGGARDVVFRQGSGELTNPQNDTMKYFLENAEGDHGPMFMPSHQTTWARSLDSEYGGDCDTTIAGGTTWVLNFKSESTATLFDAEDGAQVEVFGGYNFMYLDAGSHPMLRDDASSLSFIGAATSNGDPWSVAVDETQGGATRSAAGEQMVPFPARGADYVVPLYVGRP